MILNVTTCVAIGCRRRNCSEMSFLFTGYYDDENEFSEGMQFVTAHNFIALQFTVRPPTALRPHKDLVKVRHS